jgi:predicted nucleic acid-binding protein
MDAETILTAVTAHRELGSRGHHRVPIPDLLIAACAQQYQAAVLHVDRHYDVLADVLAFEPVQLAT